MSSGRITGANCASSGTFLTRPYFITYASLDTREVFITQVNTPVCWTREIRLHTYSRNTIIFFFFITRAKSRVNSLHELHVQY